MEGWCEEKSGKAWTNFGRWEAKAKEQRVWKEFVQRGEKNLSLVTCPPHTMGQEEGGGGDITVMIFQDLHY